MEAGSGEREAKAGKNRRMLWQGSKKAISVSNDSVSPLFDDTYCLHTHTRQPFWSAGRLYDNNDPYDVIVQRCAPGISNYNDHTQYRDDRRDQRCYNAALRTRRPVRLYDDLIPDNVLGGGGLLGWY